MESRRSSYTTSRRWNGGTTTGRKIYLISSWLKWWEIIYYLIEKVIIFQIIVLLMKIFIDTTIFFDIYYSHNPKKLDTFTEIKKIINHLLFSEQVKDEFIRNRDSTLKNIIEDVKKTTQINNLNKIIFDKKDLLDFQEIKKKYDSVHKSLIKKSTIAFENPDKDPIYRAFIQLFDDPNVIIINRTQTIIDKAIVRKRIGNPPRSNKTTIGDEINWECLLYHLSPNPDDLLIVTNDSTYKDQQTFLKREFFNLTKKKLIITEKLSDAFEVLKITPSDEIKTFDKEKTERIPADLIKFDWLENLGPLVAASGFSSSIGSLATRTPFIIPYSLFSYPGVKRSNIFKEKEEKDVNNDKKNKS